MRIAVLVLLAACASTSKPEPKPAAVAPVAPTKALVGPMARVAFMRGLWRGPARGTTPDGHAYSVTQTERMGPMLGGDITVIEGRGYNADGSTGFNAFAVVSYDARADRFELRSYAQGNSGTFELALTADGYTWQVPAGPEAILRFTATVHGDHWREVGELVAKDRPPVQTFEMNLTRVGETDWPLGTPVSPR